MHLWTEYEGNTLAGYPLGRLTRSEGRSAFFSTTTPEGKAALLRLTESHFDDSELIHRWQTIAGVKHPNLQAIAHSGQITFDGVALACCLLEPVDMSLSDVLRERALTVDETKEVAESIAGALAALHAADLIHEHLDASNVFAHGETIKLRGDCARECHGDFEADTEEARDALRERDVHDLGLLLLRCLGLEWQGNTASMPIPVPFDRILPRALKGDLTAEGIVAALDALKPVPIAAAKPSPVVAVAPTGAVKTSAARPNVAATATSPDAVLAAIADREAPRASKPLPSRQAPDDPYEVGFGSLRNAPRLDAGTSFSASGFVRKARPIRVPSIRRSTWIASGAAAVLLGVVLWNSSAGKRPVPAPQTPVVHAASEAVLPQAALPKSSAKPSATTPRSDLFTSSAQAGWRVIAYTYNYEQQAQAKAMQIRARYSALQPQVFSPTGRAPYFVALGGPSDAASAMALRNRARRAGLPRDTFARNF